MPQVAGKIDRGHAAAPKLALKYVAIAIASGNWSCRSAKRESRAGSGAGGSLWMLQRAPILAKGRSTAGPGSVNSVPDRLALSGTLCRHYA